VEAPVPGGKHGLIGGKEQCGGQVQGIEAAQVVVNSEPCRVLAKPLRQMNQPSVACISVRTRSLPGSAPERLTSALASR